MTATAEHAAPQTLEFKTELKQLLDLIIHSLYTKKEIFLRELVSNAADAIDKLRFQGLQHPEVLQGDSDWKIRLVPDEKAGTLTISDNGLGMSRETIVDNLGTIAKSGTRAFLDTLKQADVKERPELIGQFGVGFYSSFMVADKVTVISRPAGPGGENDAVKWESDGQGQYTVEAAEKSSRGTDVILHLREDAKEFLADYRLRQIVKRYSDYVEHPVVSIVTSGEEGKEETKEETLNSRQAIWLRPKHEVKAEETAAFYKQISHDDADPLKTIHIAAEGGAVEFRALVFIPKKRGFDWMGGPEKKSSVDLYVRRVLIQHESEELIPSYLRFVKGVVDCLDLPLNVSRETIQHDPRLTKIKTNLTSRVLKTLEDLKNAEYDTYVDFYKEFNPYLKEGVAQDYGNREKLSDLLLFESTKTEPGKFTTLAKYIETMPADQKEVLYLTGDSRELIQSSPHLEAYKAKGQEVLLLTDSIDEFWVGGFFQYKGKNFKAVDRVDAETDKEAEEKRKAAEGEFKTVLEAIKVLLGDEVKDVRLSTRLKESASVLVTEEGAMSPHMERLMARMGKSGEVPPSKRVLELNPDHPAVKSLRTLADKNPADERIEAWGNLFHDQALIAEGSRVKDPAAFAKRINDLIAKAGQ